MIVKNQSINQCGEMDWKKKGGGEDGVVVAGYWGKRKMSLASKWNFSRGEMSYITKSNNGFAIICNVDQN